MVEEEKPDENLSQSPEVSEEPKEEEEEVTPEVTEEPEDKQAKPDDTKEEVKEGKEGNTDKAIVRKKAKPIYNEEILPTDKTNGDSACLLYTSFQRLVWKTFLVYNDSKGAMGVVRPKSKKTILREYYEGRKHVLYSIIQKIQTYII